MICCEYFKIKVKLDEVGGGKMAKKRKSVKRSKAAKKAWRTRKRRYGPSGRK